jgi:hypothetical protein
MSCIIIENTNSLKHEEIQEIFDTNRIGSVIQVTIFPEYQNEIRQTINKAYVLIEEWYDTESAFNFIKETQTDRGSLMHCFDSKFCVVKQTEPTPFHNRGFESKWTQHFENKAKQEFIRAENEYQMEIKEYQMEIAVEC